MALSRFTFWHQVHEDEAKCVMTEYLHEDLTREIINGAIRVHRSLGPGLLESVYEVCLTHELLKKDIRVQRQVALPVQYDNIELEAGFRLDLLVDDAVIVEIKAVDVLSKLHEAQLMTYLRLSGKEVGLLINFNELRLRDGIRRRALSRPPA